MKKKILFVIPSLGAGGAEKSLVNLLNQIDFELYEVDLFLFSNEGLFLNSLPKEVYIIGHDKTFKKFNSALFDSSYCFLRKAKISLFFSRIKFFLTNRLNVNSAIAEQNSWKHLSKSIFPLEKKYDAAIGFLEKSSIYFIVDKVKAEIKIGWIHTNYATSGMNALFDSSYFKKLNHLVTVSDECAKSLNKFFPALSEKVKVIENIISPKIIRNLAALEKVFEFDKQNISIVTIARLSAEKGIDLAVASCAILLKEFPNLQWFVIGEGAERIELEKKIKEFHLENSIFLLGLKENPYPYVRLCDIYVQPSRYEGKSISVDEAKILGKPIVVTNFTTAKDQINGGVNGIIAEMNPEAIANAVLYIIKNKNIRAAFTSNLSHEKLGTEEEIHKLYALIH